jgi:hypothetical protein
MQDWPIIKIAEEWAAFGLLTAGQWIHNPYLLFGDMKPV